MKKPTNLDITGVSFVVAVTPKTTGQRVAALRQRRADLGLTRLELYAHPDDHEAIKEHAAKLQRKRARIEAIRVKVG